MTVVAKLKGGLGNQLFIYFAAAFLAERTNANLVLDTSEIGNADTFRGFGLDNLDLPIPYKLAEFRFSFRNRFLRKLLRELRSFRHRLSKDFIHSSEEIGFVDLTGVKSGSGSIYLNGYYQSWRFYSGFEELHGPTNVQPKVKSNLYLEHIERIKTKNVIAVHIRRGDFLKFKGTIGVLSLDYYRAAILVARSSNPDSEVWAFSDDLEFLQQNRDYLGIDYIPDELNTLTETESLFLMSNAKTIVTSNSTFSWWAATLSPKGTRVYCPDPWHKSAATPLELLPPTWIRIESKWI